MNVRERCLAVFDDEQRKNLDRVPSFVQYIRDEFIFQYDSEILNKYDKSIINNHYFGAPYVLGFDSVFAPFPPSVNFKPVRIEDKEGNKVRININGQATRQKTPYYEGGYIHSLEVLDTVRANASRVDRIEQIKKVISHYEKLSSYIFPMPTIDGIFDPVWKSMGMIDFSINFRKNTKLYKQLIKFRSEIVQWSVEGLIEATAGEAKIVTFLDDVAFKGRPMISPERWQQDFLPSFKEINSMISDAGLISQIHTDGDVTQLIPAFQKAGFQSLQGWEGGCDPYYISDKFPDFVVVGFGDVSDILPFGTTDQVEAHVKDLMNALKDNRHFIIGPSTVIYKGIPIENVREFMQSIKKYGDY